MTAFPKHSYRRINGYKAKLLERVRNLQPSLASDIADLKIPWYYIKNAVVPEEEKETDSDESTDESVAEVFIYDEIGGSFGVDANEFIQDLQDIKAKEITLRINSPGGNVIDAIAIYNALVQHPAYITTRVDSIAASAASVVAMGGDVVEMMIGSQMMIHDAMTTEMGNAKELRETAKWLDMQSDNIASMYAAKGGDKQDWRALMIAETWMFAEEAVTIGLADSVYTRAAKREMEKEMEKEMEEDEEMMPEKEDEEKEKKEGESEEAHAIALLMNYKHRLTNRGYKYAGRSKAPHPTDIVRNIKDIDTDLSHEEFVAALLGER